MVFLPFLNALLLASSLTSALPFSGIARRQARRAGLRSSQGPAWLDHQFTQTSSAFATGAGSRLSVPGHGGHGPTTGHDITSGNPHGSSSSGDMQEQGEGQGKGKGNTTTVIKQTTYTQNWAGAVFESGSFTTVSGTITVPTPATPSGGDPGTAYTASAWVGIDGATCSTGAILQTGIDFTIQNGAVSIDAWYEWLPAAAFDWTSGISFSPGDTVTMSVTASSSTTGSASITNESNGQSVSIDLSSETALCEQNAEWIVEDYQINGEFAPFTAFSPVTFTNTQPSASGATVVDIYQGTALTSSSIGSDGSVSINYIG